MPGHKLFMAGHSCVRWSVIRALREPACNLCAIQAPNRTVVESTSLIVYLMRWGRGRRVRAAGGGEPRGRPALSVRADARTESRPRPRTPRRHGSERARSGHRAPKPPTASASEQVCDFDVKRIRDLDDYVESGVATPSFDAPVVSPVDPCIMREVLLRPTRSLSQFSHARTERYAVWEIGHRPTMVAKLPIDHCL